MKKKHKQQNEPVPTTPRVEESVELSMNDALQEIFDASAHRASIVGLKKSEMGLMDQKCSENGWICDNTKEHLIPMGNPAYASIIPSSVFAIDPEGKCHMQAAAITNTLNEGFVFCAPDPDGGVVHYAEVDLPCIVGNVSEPKGVYVPLNDSVAIADAIVFLGGIMDKSTGCSNCEHCGEDTNHDHCDGNFQQPRIGRMMHNNDLTW